MSTGETGVRTYGDCPECQDVEKRYSARTSGRNLFVVHTERESVKCGAKSKNFSKKKKVLQLIEKIVSALRNTRGGELIIHLKGQQHCDRYLEHFDEFIAKRFGDLIGDGNLYVDTYVRDWLSELSEFSKYSDFILIKVSKSRGIVTVDYNTKIRNDIENLSPSTVDVVSVLYKTHKDILLNARLRGLPRHLHELHECRCTELKTITSDKYEPIKNNIESLVKYIWSELKLKENITAISKVSGGGSYYVGVSEKRSCDSDYETKIPDLVGFQLSVDKSDFVHHLQHTITANTCVLYKGEFHETPSTLTNIELHQIPHTENLVLEVAISYFDGLVFSDKGGPRTYLIKDDTIHRMEKMEWLNRLSHLTYRWA